MHLIWNLSSNTFTINLLLISAWNWSPVFSYGLLNFLTFQVDIPCVQELKEVFGCSGKYKNYVEFAILKTNRDEISKLEKPMALIFFDGLLSEIDITSNMLGADGEKAGQLIDAGFDMNMYQISAARTNYKFKDSEDETDNTLNELTRLENLFKRRSLDHAYNNVDLKLHQGKKQLQLYMNSINKSYTFNKDVQKLPNFEKVCEDILSNQKTDINIQNN